MNLAIKLQNNGVITTPKILFQEFDQKEISDLIGHSVFKFKLLNKNDYDKI